MKENLILNYCITLKKKYNISNRSSRYLYNMIKNSLYDCKTHSSDDIIMKNGEIHNIEDIVFNKKTKSFVNNRLFETDDNSVNETKTNYLNTCWSNYIKNMIKTVSDFQEE